MKQNAIETLMGALVLMVAVGFLAFAYKSADLNPTNDAITIEAKFEQADGLEIGSAVRMGGIKIGEVTQQSLDPQNYLAVIAMKIRKEVPLPKDSSAKIVSSGLLGSKYVSLTPGADDTMLREGDVIAFTQSSVNFESLLAKFIFSSKSQDKSDSEDK